MRHPIQFAKRPITSLVNMLGFGAKVDAMDGIVMNPTLDARLRVVSFRCF